MIQVEVADHSQAEIGRPETNRGKCGDERVPGQSPGPPDRVRRVRMEGPGVLVGVMTLGDRAVAVDRLRLVAVVAVA